MSHLKTMFSAQSKKAIVAGIVATIGAATVAAPHGFGVVTALTIVGAGVGAFQGTYWTSNASAEQPATTTTQTPNAAPVADPTPIHTATLAASNTAPAVLETVNTVADIPPVEAPATPTPEYTATPTPNAT
jgi:hypothetical protein